tara:strand:+ start:36 stop:269 length:234 start_codon:yes stop_codon:yes gene_type:complete
MKKFVDYKPEVLAKKLKDVEEYEKNMGVDDRSKAWRRWLESKEYREREWQWRQSLAAIHATFAIPHDMRTFHESQQK